VPVSDIFTGVYSVIGILAALQRRERTGKGGYVDTALVDSTVGVLANQAMNFLASGDVPKRIGNAHPNIVPYQVFPVADGHIIIATGNDSQYGKLVTVLGEPGLAQKKEYLVNKDRLNNRKQLIDHLSTLTRKFKRDDLLDKLEAVGVPAGPINDLDQVFENAQVKHRGMRINPKSDAAKDGSIPGVRTPIMLDGESMASPNPAPRLGQHTAEILREIGEN
jgi:crotonobetainyl-CoA:carnitine CoA-transferase CaiB-like acyl-CoA transferase